MLARPMVLDFAELADGVRRNNMGLGGFRLEVAATVEGSAVRIPATGQVFTLAGAGRAGEAPGGSALADELAAPAGSSWRTLKVVSWEKGAQAAVEVQDRT